MFQSALWMCILTRLPNVETSTFAALLQLLSTFFLFQFFWDLLIVLLLECLNFRKKNSKKRGKMKERKEQKPSYGWEVVTVMFVCLNDVFQLTNNLEPKCRESSRLSLILFYPNACGGYFWLSRNSMIHICLTSATYCIKLSFVSFVIWEGLNSLFHAHYLYIDILYISIFSPFSNPLLGLRIFNCCSNIAIS